MRNGLVMLIVAVGLASCGQDKDELTGASYAEYARSDAASWIALPSGASDIDICGFYGFDTNYRFIRCRSPHPSPDLSNLIAQSLKLQPRQTNDTLILVPAASISGAGFKRLFGMAAEAWPKWWDTDFDRFDVQAYCTWQDTNNYGYGYIYLLDTRQHELRAFQWSQQWNRVEATRQQLQRESSNQPLQGTAAQRGRP